MKKIHLTIIPFLLFLPLLVKGQNSAITEVKCLDYACNMDKVKVALGNKMFKEAIDYCRAAKASPDANTAEVDAVIYKILETIVTQKKIVESDKQVAISAQKKAVEDEKKAKEDSKKAENETLSARRDKESAEIIVKRADNDEKKALEVIKKAENDIEIAKRAIEKAKLDISNGIIDREKAKAAIGYAISLEKKAIDAQKKADLEAETAKREKAKAAEIIANAEKATLTSANLVKEVSDVLTGVEKKEEPVYVGSKSVEMPTKKDNTQGGIYINPTKPISYEKLPNKRIELLKLQKAVDAEKDKLKAYTLQGKLIDSLEMWFQRDTSYRSDLAESYANKAWSALFLKKFADSEQACYKGLTIDPNKRFINAIMGHSLLFQGNLEAAMRVYLEYARDARQYKNKSNRSSIIEDLDVLKQDGISHKDVPKVKAALLENKK